MVLDNENLPIFLKDFFESLDFIYVGEWKIPVMGIIVLICSLIGIYFFNKFLGFFVSRKLRKKGISPDMYNGMKFFLKFGLFFMIAMLVSYLLNIPPNSVALVVGIVATAVSFASMKSINNFIAGVWITITRPLYIGDYVNIGGKEGLIFEMTLNYTKLLNPDKSITMIPNLECLKSNITNYSISLNWFIKEIDKLEYNIKKMYNLKKLDENGKISLVHLEKKLAQMKKNYQYMGNILKVIEEKGINYGTERSKYTDDDKIVRYSFIIKLKHTPKKNHKILALICEKWKEEFEIMPTFRIIGLDAFIDYNITIMTPDPMDIIKYIDDFKKDVYNQVYSS